MENLDSLVHSKDGGEWPVTLVMPETLEEASEVYGESGALILLRAGLKVKQQNIARTAFRQGKERDEVDKLVANYRPGQSNRKSKQAVAAELIAEKAPLIAGDADLQEKLTEAMVKSNWQGVIDLLQD